MKQILRRGLSRLFWNGDQRRPRAPFRVAVSATLVLFFVLLLGIVAAVVGVAVGALGPLSTAVAEILSVAVLTVAVLGVVRVVDRRRVRDIGLSIDADWRREFGVGVLIGTLMVALVVVLILLTAGSVVRTVLTRDGSLFSGLSVPVSLLATAAFFLAVGTLEELIFRGYLLVNVAEGARIALDSRRAVLLGVALSAAVFGLAHASNPSASAVSTLTIALFGLLLGGAYALTDSLAVPIGIHTGWNFVLGSVFGLPVSGLTTSVAILAVDPGTNAALTGGGFGPEGGIVALGGLFAGAAVLVLWLRQTDRLSISKQIAEPDLLTRP